MPIVQMPVQSPQPWPPRSVVPQPQVAGGTNVPAAWSPPPTFRGKIELDEPPDPLARPLTQTNSPPLSLPSPEEIGMAAPRPASKVDWNATHDRLHQLGGVGLRLAQLDDSNMRVSLVMRTNQPNVFHHIDATAATEAEAVTMAMTRAEQWVAGH
jgi:hypothetical protein